MKLKILVTAGDGIGPEVTNEAVGVLREVADLGGHTLEIDSRRIGGVAIVNVGTPLPLIPLTLLSPATRSFSAQSAAMNSIPFPRTDVPKPACCSFEPRSADLPTCARRSRSKNSQSTARFVRKSSQTLTSSLCVNFSEASTSANPANGIAKPARPGTRCATLATRSNA